MNTINKITVYSIVFCLFAFFVCSPLHAQKTKKGMIWGELLDNFTRESLIGAKVTLLTADSVAIDSIITNKSSCVNNIWGAWYFEVPFQMEKSLVKFEYDGYETCYLAIPAHTFKGRNDMKRFDAYTRRIPRSRMDRDLKEVAVVATKVKFYMKKIRWCSMPTHFSWPKVQCWMLLLDNFRGLN